MPIIRYLKNRKEEKRKIKEEIENYIKEENYYMAGIVAENSSFISLRILSGKYYRLLEENFPKKIMNKLRKQPKTIENLFPLQEYHRKVVKNKVSEPDYCRS